MTLHSEEDLRQHLFRSDRAIHFLPDWREHPAVVAPGGSAIAVPIQLEPNLSKVGLLDALATALRFPSYFGRNWDALADMLTDVSVMPAGALLLIFDGASSLAAHELSQLFVILDDAARYWRCECQDSDERALAIIIGPALLKRLLPEIEDRICDHTRSDREIAAR